MANFYIIIGIVNAMMGTLNLLVFIAEGGYAYLFIGAFGIIASYLSFRALLKGYVKFN